MDTTERLHFHFSHSCIGEGNGNPLQCSCLESPRDGGAWWAAIYGVAQSWTRLKQVSSSSSNEISLLWLDGSCLPALCEFWELFFVLPHGVSSSVYIFILHPTVFSNRFKRISILISGTVFPRIFSSLALCAKNSTYFIREFYTLPGLACPMPWSTKDFRVIVARTRVTFTSFIFLFPGSQSFTTYCPIYENCYFFWLLNSL